MEIIYSERRDIAPVAIQDLRRSIGWNAEAEADWRASLQQARAVASAWDGKKLAGICFLSGLELTGMVSDFTVHADYQQQGIGREIMQRILDRTRGMQNVFLFYDSKDPSLKDYYVGLGFKPLDSGMVYSPSANKPKTLS